MELGDNTALVGINRIGAAGAKGIGKGLAGNSVLRFLILSMVSHAPVK